MAHSARLRIRRLRLLADEWGILFAVAAVFILLAQVEDTYGRAWSTTDSVFLSVPVVLAVVALWPVRVLEIGALGIRYRERLLGDVRRLVNFRAPRARKAAWSSVAEILLTSRYGLVVLVIGRREAAGGLRAAVVELPVGDEQAVADAIAASAPGVPVLRVPPAEALARTRQPYVPRRRMTRIWLLIAGVVVLGGVFDVVRAFLWDTPYLAMTGETLLLCALIQRVPPAPVVGPDGILLGRWPRRRVVTWPDVVSIRPSAESGTLTVCDRSGRVFTQQISCLADLADLRAILTAYAPPAALGSVGGLA